MTTVAPKPLGLGDVRGWIVDLDVDQHRSISGIRRANGAGNAGFAAQQRVV
jgi:hypothetical protein